MTTEKEIRACAELDVDTWYDKDGQASVDAEFEGIGQRTMADVLSSLEDVSSLANDVVSIKRRLEEKRPVLEAVVSFRNSIPEESAFFDTLSSAISRVVEAWAAVIHWRAVARRAAAMRCAASEIGAVRDAAQSAVSRLKDVWVVTSSRADAVAVRVRKAVDIATYADAAEDGADDDRIAVLNSAADALYEAAAAADDIAEECP